MEKMKSLFNKEKLAQTIETLKYALAIVTVLTVSSCGSNAPEGTVTTKSKAHDAALQQATESKEDMLELETKLKEATAQYKADSITEVNTNQQMVDEAKSKERAIQKTAPCTPCDTTKTKKINPKK